MTAATTTTSTATTRLHITPFTPDILPSVLPPSVKPTATEISFHILPTFPENNYGYVTLPTMEAEKIKRKLHGSILKGKKFKVETARLHKEKELEPNESDSAAERSSKKKKSSKKRKASEDVLDGYELPSDRKVKRGWTESTDAKAERRKEEKKKGKEEKKEKARVKSKHSEKDECLFRTQMPPNKAAAVDEKQDKKSKKKKSASESVVHEFANTITHPSFIRSGAEGTPTATYEEGKGWVDYSGSVKEPVNNKTKDPQYRPGKVPGAKEKRKSKTKESKKAKPAPKEESEESEDWTSSSGSSSDDSDSESDEGVSADSDTSGESSSGQEAKEEKKQSNADVTPKPATTPDQDESSADENGQASSKGVHPLEALYKRPAANSSETKPAGDETNAFSFFGKSDDIESEEEPTEPVAPQTPFAKEDLRARELRSAAPTPDTGLVGRSIKWDDDGDEMDVDDESSIDTPVSKKGATEKEDSDFAKWFWENRGDNNRAWKKRRRDAAKEERQRENRRKGLKGR